jgi:hypothetical protein
LLSDICQRLPDDWHDGCAAIAKFIGGIDIHPNIPKIIFTAVVLYVILWILAQVNGIRRKVTLRNASIIKLTARDPSIRLRRDAFSSSAAADASIGKVARVRFRYLDADGSVPIKSRSLHRSFIVSVNAIDMPNAVIPHGGMGVDRATWEVLEAFMFKLPGQPALGTAKFYVRINRKIRGVRFLLRHPDVMLRTTGWEDARVVEHSRPRGFPRSVRFRCVVAAADQKHRPPCAWRSLSSP